MSRILLVDDEPLMLDLLELYLEPRGFSCETAESGEEAMAFVNREDFDLIILDVMMPGQNGWEIAAEIRKGSETPIIILTAMDQPEDIFRSLNSGANSHISKPIDESILLKHIETLME